MEWIKKNWLVICIGIVLIFALTGSGLLLGRGARIGKALDDAAGRVIELEESLAEAEGYIGKLESGLADVRIDFENLEREYEILEDAYNRIRRNYSNIESNLGALEDSNSTSLGIVERCLRLIRKAREDD